MLCRLRAGTSNEPNLLCTGEIWLPHGPPVNSTPRLGDRDSTRQHKTPSELGWRIQGFEEDTVSVISPGPRLQAASRKSYSQHCNLRAAR